MAFSVVGRLILAAPEDQAVRRVAWSDGRLTGDEVAVERVRMTAAGLDGKVLIGPVGRTTLTDHLSVELSALELVRSVFVDGGTIVDWPPAETWEPGRVY
ncbi:MAG: hypothetical protein M3R02_15100 [Chloroflexota bacterium]|nr:hypothetical protein [Chloroflexota bacterium]